MKVTVCFGNVRVVVPCGNGELLVGDLIHKAVIRYKKATGKSSDSWVIVHNLKSFNDGGILDPDDKLKDVADDREQLLAVYEEQGLPNISVTNGDGTSASSIGTSSPDIFHEGMGDSKTYRNDVEITCDTIPLGIMPLQVRRGSEPALNRLSPVPAAVPDPMKRWSAAVLGDQVSEVSNRNELDDEAVKESGTNNEETEAFSRFSRESGRLSILGNTTETLRWVEAADRNLNKNLEKGQLEMIKRQNSNDALHSENGISFKPDKSIVILKNEGGPLGIHVVPDYDETGRDVGLIIQGIEPGGRIDRDGRLQVQDRIIEINDQSLLNVNFQQAQEIFKEALQTNEIKLCLLKAKEPDKHTDSTLPKAVPSKKASVAVAARNANPLLVSNTRKIGKKIQIQLNKGPDGLGFSITTRDNPAGGNCPIYIKNILPKGAAVQDGRLKPGDRLLEVNNIEMTGKSQSEAVTILRNTPLGGIVNLVVSRQETESPKLPRELTDELSHDQLNQPSSVHENIKTDKNADDPVVVPWKHRETLTFDIPLNDTGSAGLGVSVKGKTSTGANGTVDLGIFIKSVITGGAASKDGRLHENDQLVNINGISLLGKSNTQAMDTLRRAIQQEGPNPDAITLTIARRIPTTSRSDQSTGKSVNITSSENDVTVSSGVKTVPETSNKIQILQPHTSSSSLDTERNANNSASDHRIEDKDLGLDVPLRNPVIDRLTGQRSVMSSLRNESYYYATHVTWSPNPMSSNEDKYDHRKLKNTTSLTSPTVNLTLDDTLILEDDDSHEMPSTKRTISVTSDEINASSKLSETDDGKSLPLVKKSDITNTSQMSLDEYGLTFSRDGFGRQSISEKRHAQLDAKNTDTYQRNKKAREEKEKQKTDQKPIIGSNAGDSDLTNLLIRANSADSLLSVSQSNRSSIDLTSKEVGPRLGMKKSSSLESLQTMVAEASNDEGENFDRPTIKTIRGRGCNESFRAAVDRSYDVPGGNVTETMETLDEESESGSSGLGRGNSRQSSLSGEYITDDIHRFNKKPKKKGLLKGLGSVFKFGKNRKLTSDQLPRLTREDLERQKIEAEKHRARKAAQEEQERIQDQYRKLLHCQIEPQANSSSVINNNHIAKDENFLNIKTAGLTNRHEKMNQLRAEHQRKHQERQGLYPGENFKDKTEQFIYAPIERQDPTRYSFQIFTPSTPIHRRANSHIHPQRFDTEILHARSHSYDLYEESGQSNKSNNQVENTDCSKYSHYANYEEIQQHLQQQQHQQQAALTQYDRPSSNYYEYESIQTALRSMKLSETNANSLPRPSHRKRSVQAVSSHPLDCTKPFTTRKDKLKDHSKREGNSSKSAIRSQEPFFLSNKNESTAYHRHLNTNSSKV